MPSTVASCLAAISVQPAVLSAASSLEEEFATIKKAYFRRVLAAHPDKGGDVDEFRVLQEAYEALRDGGGSEEAKESSPAASPRAPPTRAPPKKQSKRFRCATCGKRFSSHLALRAHSVEHPKAKDDEDRRAALRVRLEQAPRGERLRRPRQKSIRHKG